MWERTEAIVPTLTNQPRQTTPEPEHTETSYDTVPETKPESETETIEIDTNMVGESSRMRDDLQVIKLNLPKDFSGKREDLKKFLQQVNLYMDINAKTYHNNMTKIAFVLSFMDEGDALSWKEQFLGEATSTSPHNYGTWADFERDLRKAFQPFNTPGDALKEIKNLLMGSNSIEDHNAKFRMLLTKSKLNKTSPAVIDYYCETLNLPLQKWLLGLEVPPVTLQEWYDKATKYDNLFQKIQRITGRGKTNNDKKEKPKKKAWTFTKKDPNAMDVDLLSTEKGMKQWEKGYVWMRETWTPQLRLSGQKEADQGLYANPFHFFCPKKYERQRTICSHLKLDCPNGRRGKREILWWGGKRGFLIRRIASTSISPILDVFSTTVATMKSNALSIPLIVNCEKNKTVETLALIDSGAGGKFIDQNYTKESSFSLEDLKEPLMAQNMDVSKLGMSELRSNA